MAFLGPTPLDPSSDLFPGTGSNLRSRTKGLRDLVQRHGRYLSEALGICRGPLQESFMIDRNVGDHPLKDMDGLGGSLCRSGSLPLSVLSATP